MILTSSEEMIGISMRLPRSDLERFDRIAANRRMSRAALFRESILKTIEAYEKTQE